MMALILAQLRERLPEDKKVLLVVTADHSTPVLHGDHSCEAVPLTVCDFDALPDISSNANANGVARGRVGGEGREEGKGLGHWTSAFRELHEADCTASFDEVAMARGVLGRLAGAELMPLLKRLRGAASSGKPAKL